MRRLSSSILPLLLIATQWDLLPWFFQRAGENEDAALLHLILVVGLGGWWIGRIRRESVGKTEDGLSRPSTENPDQTCRAKSPTSFQILSMCRAESPTSFQILSMAGLLLCALLGFLDTYPLIRMTALALTLAATLLMQLPHPRRYALAVTVACLLLPFSEETAAFFLGYPARWLATVGAGFLLTLSGYVTDQQGAVLFVNGQPLFADAPCAGLMMGWTGFAISSLIALYHRLNFKRSLILYASTGALILIGNAMRIAILAQLEQLLPHGSHSPLLHNGIGIFSFIILLPLLVWIGKADSSQDTSTSPQRNSPTLPWILCLLLASAAPLLQPSSSEAPATSSSDVPFPDTWQGEALTPLPDSELDQRFARNFTGHMARYQSGTKNILFRWLDQPSRQLHPSVHCYRAMGYRIRPLPAKQNTDETLWSRYEARKGDEQLIVREQIQSLGSTKTWPDVTAWYWEALTRRDPGPWLAVTIAEEVPPK